MNLTLTSVHQQIQASIRITGSKSESNRLLLLQALYPSIKLKNISNSDDSRLMRAALSSEDTVVDIHHAGTAMRFLSAYFSVLEGREVLLTGSKRMKERPVKILVDGLKKLGADISYTENEGYPPLKIKGATLKKNELNLKASVSSQYISALLLIAPKLAYGLKLHLEGDITSRPYLEMTLSLLSTLGIKNTFIDNTIVVFPKESLPDCELVVESDWSSASYFYSIASLSEKADITLSSYKLNSLQGDSVLSKIYRHFGVETHFDKENIRLVKHENSHVLMPLNIDLIESPDIAQTIVVSCFGNGIGCHLTGLHTLKIKETDRLEALKIELSKLGAIVHITEKELILEPSDKINSNITIDTYNDHRMAMAFAPLALKVPIVIGDAEVVSKSYPDFWKDLETVGILNKTQV